MYFGGRRFSLFLLLLLSFVSCRDDIRLPDDGGDDSSFLQAGDSAAQTLLLYIVGDNNLSDDFQGDLAEVLRAASRVPGDCFMLAYVDDYHSPRLIRFFNDGGEGNYETVYNFEREMSSCDTLEMRDVFEIVQREYPSKVFDVIFGSHGSGWLFDDGNRRPQLFSFGDDGVLASGGANGKVYVEELAFLLGSLSAKPRRVMFDACFMQCAEVAYAMRDCAEWLIGSPAEIPSAGAPYDVIIPLFFNSTASVADIMDAYVACYEGGTDGVILSAVRLGVMQEFARATAVALRSAFGSLEEIDHKALFSYLPGGYFYYGKKFPCFHDINHAMRACLQADAYNLWREAFEKAVPYISRNALVHSYIKGLDVLLNDACGALSIYLPSHDARYTNLNEDFRLLEWYEAAGWNEVGW